MRFAPLFHDHAVLQRDLSLPIWGTATPGELVTVRLAGRAASVTAGRDGRWFLRLPPQSAGGPFELVGEAASGRMALADILIGDVWICSGQSNMEWKLQNSDPEGRELPSADQSRIRLLTVTAPAAYGRGEALDGAWQVATREQIAAFSAVGGWFGRELQRELDVPIGLICNAWGGTRIQAWTSREALVQDPQAGDEIRSVEAALFSAERKKPQWNSMAEWERGGAPQDAGDQGSAKGWHTAGFDDSAWKKFPVPGHWQNNGHPGSGIFWFRRTVTIPAAWRGRDLHLGIGAVDKHDDTFVNGERVGGLSWETANAWCTPRRFTVPARLIGADGRVTIAVRARSHVFHGGITGPVSELRLHVLGDRTGELSLAGSWAYAVEQDWGLVNPPQFTEFGPGNPNSAGILFDARLSPLIPYGIRGAIWYQGESNAGEAVLYRRLMRLMIQDWRRAWGQGNFPFIQVQLANFHPALDIPAPSDWAMLREAQARALVEPATGLAVAIDIGEALDIHPKNKKDVGIRLARWALAEHYGRGGVASGPVFTGCTFEPGQVRCRFAHVGGGLVARDGALQRFAIANDNRGFIWAQARIEGETVVVSHPDIDRPAAVRYAWSNNPEGCNLYNAAGLPAVPFRSDDWPM